MEDEFDESQIRFEEGGVVFELVHVDHDSSSFECIKKRYEKDGYMVRSRESGEDNCVLYELFANVC